ncbi:protein translocase subunit SecD [Gallaecimonas pentaromativorans]|uniref:Protein translocase subunit SecD n=1 Tax=Gallaecimonas pentaromativorans TaxID=584787 RepID=A0A3N1PB92_9GAMM|nr:protein translocase subunit SecD [Gallaecimonas pentaromativorans]MED5524673.1 protein translocase subunit SecD [Pseudomonadota bacterium]ROQ28662.1 preprotein translocase subunit SecD [Gallaecimonas pentaromativorans]
MLNKYPLWKYLMLIVVVVIGFLYAAPNLYGEDPAIQVSGVRSAVVDNSTLDKVRAALKEDGITAKSIAVENGLLLARFSDTETQLKAQEVVTKAMGDDYSVALNLAPATPAWLRDVHASPMKLGLDLRGGVHFLMQVDMPEAITKAENDLQTDLRTNLREEKLRYTGIRRIGEGKIKVTLRDDETAEQAETFLKKSAGTDYQVDRDGKDVVLTLTPTRIKEIREYALSQNITIIRNRVNELGVAEPLVQRQGTDRILVELPGVQDTARAKEILGATATLEFHLVDTQHDLGDALNGHVPPGSVLYKSRDGRPVLAEKRIMLTGDHIQDAQSGFDEYQRPQVNIKLDSQGGDMMSRATKDNIGKPMATVFIEYKPTGEKGPDGKPTLKKVEEVIQVATIQARLGRSFRITGINTPQEAHNLSLLLRAGALLAPIQIVEERTVGPSLGAQNIQDGMNSLIYGSIAILIFMAIYYRAFGLVANLALVMNVVLIVGIMSLIPGATLTLPGIAGIVLTVGMSVDANVLIFERIREELNAGVGVQKAIHNGYSNALSTIADANITTMITALILFGIGSGPVKGFAVTLAIGILTSMFTAIVGTRAVINLIYGGRRVEKLSI